MKRILKMMLIAFMLFSCSNEPIQEELITADARANISKGKKQRSVYLKPTQKASTARIAAFGRIGDDCSPVYVEFML
jgi:hypothetical protein